MDGVRPRESLRDWLHDRALTLVLLAMFLVSLIGQFASGHREYNSTRLEHNQPAVSATSYAVSGHWLESVFETWESEFLQMAVFILLTTVLVQKGSPESRRAHVRELVDADPRDHADDPDAPWPVRRGGWIVSLYENSLGIAFIALFLISWAGHALGGFVDYAENQALHGGPKPSVAEYLSSSRFWFESFQNWQSEFLSIAAMVWLAVYLRQRGSPESKPVHASHDDHD